MTDQPEGTDQSEPSVGSEQVRRETWEARYREADRVWSGEPNAVLVDLVSPLPTGRALDLGCGEGADTIWLASRGWQVTGIDISPTALERAGQAERESGVATGRITWVASDLATWHPEARYDLVSAFFLHSHTADLPRTEILRRAAGAVAAGGRLLVVGHAAPPWGDGDDPGHDHDEHDFLSADEQVAELSLDADSWRIEVAQKRSRERRTDGAETVTVDDVVVLARRVSPQ